MRYEGQAAQNHACPGMPEAGAGMTTDFGGPYGNQTDASHSQLPNALLG